MIGRNKININIGNHKQINNDNQKKGYGLPPTSAHPPMPPVKPPKLPKQK